MNVRKPKPIVPKPASGNFPVTTASYYLESKGWIPFIFKNQVKWIDPIKNHDISLSEIEAVRVQLSRDKANIK